MNVPLDFGDATHRAPSQQPSMIESRQFYGPTPPKPRETTPTPTAPPSAELKDTPVGKKSSGFIPYTSTHRVTDVGMREMAAEMRGKLLGPMDVESFLERFLPKPKDCPVCPKVGRAFHAVAKAAKETDMYDPFIDATKSFAPNLTFVNCSNTPDTLCVLSGAPLKPDICAYTKDSMITEGTHFSEMEIHAEFKWSKSHDPFRDDPAVEFEHDSESSKDTLGQLVAYAAAQLGTQFRSFIFTLGVFGETARIIRWDRSGAVVTKAFSYLDKPQYLAKFFWRYDHTSPSNRGQDVTVSIPEDGDASEARAVLQLPESTPLVQFEVPDDTGQQEPAYYIGARPKFESRSLTGRATRPFIVYDVENKRRVFLKDTWRIDLPDVEKEGAVYARLKQHGVPYIAEFGRAGDIGHRTATQDLVKRFPSAKSLVPHKHYRLVLLTVGRDLTSFESSYELVTAIADAIEAHKIAWESPVETLHRDISVGNIMIDEHGRGLLVDWELSKRKSRLGQGARRFTRTGTWQFMSAALLMDPSEGHKLVDDLESFLHVLSWVALRFSRNALPPERLSQLLETFFDASFRANGVSYGGQAKADAIVTRRIPKVEFKDRPILNELLDDLTTVFSARYDVPSTKEPRNPLERKRLLLEREIHEDRVQKMTSEWVLDTVRQFVAERNKWPQNDRWERQPLGPSEDRSRRKRRSDESRLDAFMPKQPKKFRSTPVSGDVSEELEELESSEELEEVGSLTV